MKKVAFLLFFVFCGTSAWAGPIQDKNKVIARRVFEEILSQGKFQVADEIYAPDFVNHGVQTSVGLKEDQDAARGWRTAFPDLKMNVVLMVAEDDLVTVLWTASGTNTGQGNGLPATGKTAEGRGITVWRIVGGKIREEWTEYDSLRLMKQLGLLPAGEKARGSQPGTAMSTSARQKPGIVTGR
jgi:steroid delta-isomerase-like uncharacterized protein